MLNRSLDRLHSQMTLGVPPSVGLRGASMVVFGSSDYPEYFIGSTSLPADEFFRTVGD